MSATKNAEGDLVPLSANVVEWVYGNAEYVGSVFGTTNPTRLQLADYYKVAQETWLRVLTKSSHNRKKIYDWLKASDIRGLDYYFPIGYRQIWFKHPQDAFAFKLKFGDFDNGQ